ncbi:hypothetical protein Vafri_18964, partial [Volvox africanus]
MCLSGRTNPRPPHPPQPSSHRPFPPSKHLYLNLLRNRRICLRNANMSPAGDALSFQAVFLGALMTAGWQDLDRLPLAFKSTVQGQTYRHIVLAVFHAPSRTWGALGLSRRPELMDKDLEYDSLADLVSEYKSSYERWWHTLVR